MQRFPIPVTQADAVIDNLVSRQLAKRFIRLVRNVQFVRTASFAIIVPTDKLWHQAGRSLNFLHREGFASKRVDSRLSGHSNRTGGLASRHFPSSH